ncbi:MAG: hypothetical protein WCH99_13685 [Verrucomicrobiota bacterium]
MKILLFAALLIIAIQVTGCGNDNGANGKALKATAQPEKYSETDLPFKAALAISKGGGFSELGVEENGVIVGKLMAEGVTISTLTLGGKDIALLSTNVTPDVMVLTKDYGKLGLKMNNSTFSCTVLVTPKQEEQFRKLLLK